MTGGATAFNGGVLSLRKNVPLYLLFFALLACAPAALSVSVKPDSGLTRARTLKISAEHGDPVGVKGKLERLLHSKGFRLVAASESDEEYLLRFRYVFLTGFRRFTAIVVDKSSNEVIVVCDFEGYRIGDGLLEEFVDKFAEQVR